MIDLHIHSTFSDGADNLKQIVEKANGLNLEVISITDHNKCYAYLNRNAKPLKAFKGQVIAGCEFTASYKNMIIEILGYSYDIKKIARFIKATYPSFKKDKFRRLYLTIKKLEELNIVFSKKRLIKNVNKGSTSLAVLSEILSDEKNAKFLNGQMPDKRVFLRHYLNNPNSPLYINYGILYPTLKEVTNAIHDSGGICFLAHPYEYSFNLEKELGDILTEAPLNGLECYYTTFTIEQTNFLLNYCKNHNLLISGGTDYHGANRSKNQLGTGVDNNFSLEKNTISWIDNVKKFS